MFSHFDEESKLILPSEPLTRFSKNKTMISNKSFKAMFDQLPQIEKKFF